MQKDKYDFGIMPTIEDLSSYESPIQVTCREMQNTFDGDVMKAVLNYGISVDKDELIRALQYDRDQYKKGFEDGVRANVGEDVAPVVRCRDCKHYSQNPWNEKEELLCKLWTDWLPTEPSDFCSYGERRSGDESVETVSVLWAECNDNVQYNG